MPQLTCGFIGLGLIGGSIAKALKSAYPEITIIAMDTNEESLSLALSENIAHVITTKIDQSFFSCDCVFLCAPVSCNEENLLLLKRYIPSTCIITDVGSVKAPIHNTVEKLGLCDSFIGGHPMAGSERIGYQNAKAQLLENAYYILTPTSTISAEKLNILKNLTKAMGSIPLVLDAQEHDYITAAISHLPHVIASALVHLVKDSDSSDGRMKMIAAGGFKDITRIASSSASMWQQICLTNTKNISLLLGNFIDLLTTTKSKLDSHNAQNLLELFEEAQVYRDSFIESSSGPIKKSHAISIDIADETGALASIATILALKQISIKNIGILHNREFEEGVLKIEFYEEDSIEKAKNILRSRGYTIYEK